MLVIILGKSGNRSDEIYDFILLNIRNNFHKLKLFAKVNKAFALLCNSKILDHHPYLYIIRKKNLAKSKFSNNRPFAQMMANISKYSYLRLKKKIFYYTI